MSKVAQAANKIMKLPVMPHRQYIIVLSSPLALDFAPNCCMGSSWSGALPPKTAERNFEAELTKCSEFQLGFRWTIGELRIGISDGNSRIRYRDGEQGDLAQGVREAQPGEHSPPARSCEKLSCITWLCMIWFSEIFVLHLNSEGKYFHRRELFSESIFFDKNWWKKSTFAENAKSARISSNSQ